MVITVAGNEGKELAPGTLNAILKKAGLKWVQNVIRWSSNKRPRLLSLFAGCSRMCRHRRHRGRDATEFSGRHACPFRCYAGGRRADSGTTDIRRLCRSRRL